MSGSPPNPGPDPTDGMAPVVRLLSSLAAWVDQNRSLIREANALLDARAHDAMHVESLPRAVIEVATTLASIAESAPVDVADEMLGSSIDEMPAFTPTPAAQRAPDPVSVAELLSRFGGGGATSTPTMAETGRATTRESTQRVGLTAAQEFLEDIIDRLRAVQSNARLIASGLRLELARRGGSADAESVLRQARDVDDALRAARLEPWPLEDAVRGADDDSVELAQESYRGISVACDQVASFIEARAIDVCERRPKVIQNLDYLVHRLAAFQNAALHAGRPCRSGHAGFCPVQESAHRVLRDLVNREALEIKIKRFMRLDEHATAEDVERAHEEIELFRARFVEGGAGLKEELTARRQRRRTRRDREARSTHRFRTVADALDAAIRDYFSDAGNPSPVVITKAAQDSAEDSPFLRPDDVYDFFGVLDRVARSWVGNLLNRPFNEAMRDHGYEEKGNSKTAESRFRRHYQVHWRGRLRVMGYHYTFGARDANTCLSIHWLRDEDERKIVVGHCGNHLPNTLS